MLNHEIHQGNLKQSKAAYSVSLADYEEALKKSRFWIKNKSF